MMHTDPLLQPAVFVDRDGVINVNRDDYVRRWEEFEFIPGVLEALAALAQLGLPIFVVTNQSCIGRGLVLPQVIESIHQRMIQVIEEHGGRVDGVVLCPHVPDDNCNCRKPKPGLLIELAQQHGLDLQRSFLIGDALSDAQTALAAGVHPILLEENSYRKGYAREAILALPSQVAIVPDLAAATGQIRNQLGGQSNCTPEKA
jgi:D-glycero-D-manno-heptose 1,7-bisphosphate phosphatase